MRRANQLALTLDDAAVRLLDQLAEKYYGGDRSHTMRAAVASLAERVASDLAAGAGPPELDGKGEGTAVHPRASTVRQ